MEEVKLRKLRFRDGVSGSLSVEGKEEGMGASFVGVGGSEGDPTSKGRRGRGLSSRCSSSAVCAAG